MGDRRRRVGSGLPANPRGLGARHTGSVPAKGRAILLQTVGWHEQEEERSSPPRPHLGRNAKCNGSRFSLGPLKTDQSRRSDPVNGFHLKDERSGTRGKPFTGSDRLEGRPCRPDLTPANRLYAGIDPHPSRESGQEPLSRNGSCPLFGGHIRSGSSSIAVSVRVTSFTDFLPDGRCRFPFPAAEEQTLIVRHLDDQITQIDVSANRAQDGIARLRDYPSPLVTAAVTGQVDVRQTAQEAP